MLEVQTSAHLRRAEVPANRNPRVAVHKNNCTGPYGVTGLQHPTLGANAFTEDMHLFCRLPLVTLLHRLEVLSLGVRMRLLVRLSARDMISPGACFGVIRVPNGAKSSPLSRRVSPCHHVKCDSTGTSASKTKENSFRAKSRLVQDCHLRRRF